MDDDVFVAQGAAAKNEREAHQPAIGQGNIDLPFAPGQFHRRANDHPRLGGTAGIGDIALGDNRAFASSAWRTCNTGRLEANPLRAVFFEYLDIVCVQGRGFGAGIHLHRKINKAQIGQAYTFVPSNDGKRL